MFYVLPDTQKYEEKDLENNCWEVIDKDTDEAVKSDGFVTIERSILGERFLECQGSGSIQIAGLQKNVKSKALQQKVL